MPSRSIDKTARAESEVAGVSAHPERMRVTSTLGTAHDKHVRILCAPVGAGKTIALRHYAAHVGDARRAYVRIGAASAVGDFRGMLNGAGAQVDEIVVDGLDDAAADTVREVIDHIARQADSRRFIIAGRSSRQMHVDELLACGLAADIDPAVLAFTAEEAAQLATSYGLAHESDDVVQLVHATDGWAIAIEWVLRSASYEGHALRHAFEVWREARGQHLLRYIGAQVERNGHSFAEFFVCLAANAGHAYDDLERFHALGFPMMRTRSGLRPYRLLARLGRVDAATHGDDANVPPLRLKVLGRFRCGIGEQDIVFKRRRDRHVFLYAALKRDGRASRDELLVAFWPATPPAVAAQGLRTTLSRIRQAIGEVVGSTAVNRYLQTERDIRVNFAVVDSDVRRFEDNVERGDAEFDAGRYPFARRYYAAAERLYDDPLLSSEPVEPCFGPAIDAVERSFLWTLRRLLAIARHAGDTEAVRRYTRELTRRAALPQDARDGVAESVKTDAQVAG